MTVQDPPWVVVKEGLVFESIFARNQYNPLITPGNLPYQANAVFNATTAEQGRLP
jgi:hypothetical protein